MARADLKYIIGFETNDAPLQQSIRLVRELEAQERTLKKARADGLISARALDRGLKDINKSMAELRTASGKGAMALNKFEARLAKSGKASRQFQLAMQQGGYQVQDFIVQVQSGTNPLVAFSQQASQLAGFFAGPWGAMIGLGIAALSGLAMAFQGVGRAAKEAQEEFDAFIEKHEETIMSIRSGMTPEEINKAGQVSALFVKEQEALKELERVRGSFFDPIGIALAEKAYKKAADATSNARDQLYQMIDARELELNLIEEKKRKEAAEARAASKIASDALKAISGDPDGLSAAEKERIATENYLKSLDIALKRRTEIAGLEGESLLLKQQEYEMQDLLNKLAEKGITAESFATRQQYHNAVRGLRTAQAEELTRYRILEAEKQRLKLQKEATEGDQAMLARLRAAYDISKELTAQQQSLTDKIESSFENMFMGMVDGTKTFKDAFKAMTAEVLKEIFRITVAKRLAGLITGSVTDAIVGPVQGPMLPSLDGGGFTGYGSRSGGLDGKGGFMAMLHPNETVIDHTKGQNAGVVVNQTINVSTGVQQTVRTEIKSLMPQIAEASKAAVADAKRRGGSYGRNFA